MAVSSGARPAAVRRQQLTRSIHLVVVVLDRPLWCDASPTANPTKLFRALPEHFDQREELTPAAAASTTITTSCLAGTDPRLAFCPACTINLSTNGRTNERTGHCFEDKQERKLPPSPIRTSVMFPVPLFSAPHHRRRMRRLPVDVWAGPPTYELAQRVSAVVVAGEKEMSLDWCPPPMSREKLQTVNAHSNNNQLALGNGKSVPVADDDGTAHVIPTGVAERL
jgi:hypothetical protein